MRRNQKRVCRQADHHDDQAVYGEGGRQTPQQAPPPLPRAPRQTAHAALQEPAASQGAVLVVAVGTCPATAAAASAARAVRRVVVVVVRFLVVFVFEQALVVG